MKVLNNIILYYLNFILKSLYFINIFKSIKKEDRYFNNKLLLLLLLLFLTKEFPKYLKIQN